MGLILVKGGSGSVKQSDKIIFKDGVSYDGFSISGMSINSGTYYVRSGNNYGGAKSWSSTQIDCSKHKYLVFTFVMAHSANTTRTNACWCRKDSSSDYFYYYKGGDYDLWGTYRIVFDVSDATTCSLGGNCNIYNSAYTDVRINNIYLTDYPDAT